MAGKPFASAGDTAAKAMSFTKTGPDPYVSTADGDWDCGIIASNITYDLNAKRDRNMWGDLGETDTP
jgi:hypothetical protein